MKILIVDDEVLIREGLTAQIHWEALHIDTVLQADDGYAALAIAKAEKPEIVITDVRMQRMDGIVFAQQLAQILPETHLVFMSGYSDKEYLKAAIKLKAVSYVEKPIDCAEVEAALAEAVRLHTLVLRNKDAQNLRQQEESSRLALEVTRNAPENRAEVQALCASLNLCFKPNTRFATILAKMTALYPESQQDPAWLAALRTFVAGRKQGFLFAQRYDQYLVFHLYSENTITDADTVAFARFLQEKIQAQPTPCGLTCIAISNIVVGVDKVYLAYQSAALLIQNGFFREENAVLVYSEPAMENINAFLERCPAEFEEGLQEINPEKAHAAACQFYLSLKNCRTLTPAQVKDIYYQLLVSVENEVTERQLSMSLDRHPYTTWEAVLACTNLLMLHRLLLDNTDRMFEAVRTHAHESNTVFLMKDYIRKKYAVDALSVKDISAQVFLSVAYGCTLFKAETGQTINGFITEFRMEKAKQLLADPRYKISDIAPKVGYADANYFGKSFRRYVGLSPSEYREKVLS